MASPYKGIPPTKWFQLTKKLLNRFPITVDKMVHVVLKSWDDIFKTKIGSGSYQIGKDIFPQPQIMGFFLHELIPLNLSLEYPGQWRRGNPTEKDACYILDPSYSFEIKTSSSSAGVFGNRSYTYATMESAKSREGYMLTVNFEKFLSTKTKPQISLIRFGWLDKKDWIGQRAESGQQARLTKEAKAFKLVVIWENSK